MRRVIVVGATVLVAAAAIGLRTCAAAGREAAQPARPSAAAESADERPATGPRTEELGVPVGWSRDATGARAAAVSAVSLTGELARAGFITRSDMIRVLASRRYGPTLADLSAAQLYAFIDRGHGNRRWNRPAGNPFGYGVLGGGGLMGALPFGGGFYGLPGLLGAWQG